MRGSNALKNFARVKSEDQWQWHVLQAQYPEGLPGSFFVSVAKDPSTTRMMLRGKTEPAKYELTPERMKPEQIAMAAAKAQRRLRLEELGGVDFYFEFISKEDEDVQAAWADIVAIPAQLKSTEPPFPIHDPLLAEEDLDEECRWYCSFADRCREIQLKRQLEEVNQ